RAWQRAMGIQGEEHMENRYQRLLLAVIVLLGAAVPVTTPAAAQTFTEFPIPTAYSGTEGITTGPDGALWFTEVAGNKIGRITTAGVVTEFPIPTANSYPFGITAGPDGALWFTEANAAKIGRITTDGGIAEFSSPYWPSNSNPLGITNGPVGTEASVWFPLANRNSIGVIIPMTGQISEAPIYTNNSVPTGITAGPEEPDGWLWYTESSGNKIGHVFPWAGLPNSPSPRPIATPKASRRGR